MVRGIAVVALLAGATSASYNGNLNYRSPSTDHPSLGIDVAKVMKRTLAKRDNTDWDPASLNFTHGVASVSNISLNGPSTYTYITRATHIQTR